MPAVSSASLDIVFDRSKVYRLWSIFDTRLGLDLIAKLDGKKFPRSGYGKGVCCAMVETYGPPVITGHRIPPFEVAIKWVQNNDLAVEKLHHEADMYAGLLHPLQGYLVPICYGFFVGEVDGAQVACLVLERCKSSTKTSNDEMIQRQRAAAIGLHRMGVVHGNLLDSRGSHFLIASDGSLRIIDFTESKGHECDAISTPSVELHPVTRYSKCDELYWLHKRLPMTGELSKVNLSFIPGPLKTLKST